MDDKRLHQFIYLLGVQDQHRDILLRLTAAWNDDSVNQWAVETWPKGFHDDVLLAPWLQEVVNATLQRWIEEGLSDNFWCLDDYRKDLPPVAPAQPVVFTARGFRFERDDPQEQLNTLANEKKARKGLTFEKAYTEVLSEHPELYTQDLVPTLSFYVPHYPRWEDVPRWRKQWFDEKDADGKILKSGPVDQMINDLLKFKSALATDKDAHEWLGYPQLKTTKISEHCNLVLDFMHGQKSFHEVRESAGLGRQYVRNILGEWLDALDMNPRVPLTSITLSNV